MEKDAKLIENIRQVLDRSLDDLDPAIQSRLAQARHQAIKRPVARCPRWLYWGSVPVAGLLLLVMLLNWPAAPIKPIAAPVFSELNVLTAPEPLEFYQEDIEFYEWLSEVLEAEKELSEHAAHQSDPAVAQGSASAGKSCAGISEPRISRLSRVI